MSLIKRSDWPGSLISDFFDDDRRFNSPWSSRSLPAVNIKESEKHYDIELAAPGFEKKDFAVNIDNGVLTVTAEKREEKEKKEDQYTRREFGFASFSRSFNLPVNTNEEDVNARYQDGVLRLSIAKKGGPDGTSRRVIDIK